MTKGTALEKAIVAFDDRVTQGVALGYCIAPRQSGAQAPSADARVVLRFVDKPVISSIPFSLIYLKIPEVSSERYFHLQL
ncbi:MAG: hypothetical protein ACP5M0_13815 [Desulfomonilaceae bacterium]